MKRRSDRAVVVDGEIVGWRCNGPCGQVKKLEEFHRDARNHITGRQRHCKECTAELNNEQAKQRVRKGVVQVSFWVSREMKQAIDARARLRGLPKAEVWRSTLENAIKTWEREKKLEDELREVMAKQGAGNAT